MNTNLNHNYFEILGLDQKLTQDKDAIDKQLAQMQASVHPDSCAQATSQEKRLMVQYSAMLNEAYMVLKDPLKRAAHILELNGIEMSQDSSVKIPQAFLVMQMDLRETLEEIKDDKAKLKVFKSKTEKNYNLLMKDLTKLLDAPEEPHFEPARELVINLQFFQKLMVDIKSNLEILTSIES